MTEPRYMRCFVRRVLMVCVPMWAIASADVLQAQDALPTQSPRRARITGRVVDLNTQEALAGANIVLQGTPVTATTGADGRFVIVSAPTGIFSVEARRLGYTPNRVENVRLVADSVTTLNFLMNASMLRLDQITITGTVQETSVAKATITVDKLTSEDLPVPPTTSAAGAIAGKVAGVAITRPSGRPGSGVSIVLRTPISGISDNASVPSPLFVVDGIFLNQTQQVTTQDIEALDIESIEVIKGAAAAALYGSRAAGGVIAIKTKRGKSVPLGSTQVTVRNDFGYDQFHDRPEKRRFHHYRMNAQGQFLDASGNVVPRAQRTIESDGMIDNPYPVVYDNIGQLFKNGHSMMTQVSVAQNSAGTNYTLSYKRNRQPGVIIDTYGYLRQQLQFSIDHSLRDNLTIGVSANHTRANNVEDEVSFGNLYAYDPD
ncbi:MAG: TonB-dependent receptor plug domain-containing protein, partial [Vicinamibacterales bacterium]